MGDEVLDDGVMFSGTINYNKTTPGVVIDEEGVVGVAVGDKFKFYDTNCKNWEVREVLNVNKIECTSICTFLA